LKLKPNQVRVVIDGRVRIYTFDQHGTATVANSSGQTVGGGSAEFAGWQILGEIHAGGTMCETSLENFAEQDPPLAKAAAVAMARRRYPNILGGEPIA